MKVQSGCQFFGISTESNGLAGAHGGEFVETTEGAQPSGVRKLGPCEMVEKTMSQRSPLPPSFHISGSPEFHVPTHPPSFHIANIQN